MKIFTVKDWELIVSEEIWGLSQFKKILDRDKSKGKVVSTAEMLFIWYWSDIMSDYIGMSDEIKLQELKKDIKGLPKNWKMDDTIREAIKCYQKFESVIQRLYRQSLQSASDIGDYLENTKALLAERDLSGKPVTDIAKITSSVQKVPKLMSDLKLAYKEVVKELEDNANKQKGKQKFNMFEQGLNFDE